jgi:hypothetical protein
MYPATDIHSRSGLSVGHGVSIASKGGGLMGNEDEETRVKEPLRAIREYLSGQFEGFKLTVKSDYPVSYKFTVTKPKPLEEYSLEVTWPQLSDGNNNTARIKKLLVVDDVAKRMRAKPQGEAYSWGKN